MNRPSQEEVNDFCRCAQHGRVEGIKKYLDMYGAAIIDQTDHVHDTALTWAAWVGNVGIVALLLDSGAAIDARGMDNDTALAWAVRGGHKETVELLLDRGAALDKVNHYGLTPLMYAARRQDGTITELLEGRLRRLEERRLAEEERIRNLAARNLAAGRLEKLRHSRPGKPALRKKPPRGP